MSLPAGPDSELFSELLSDQVMWKRVGEGLRPLSCCLVFCRRHGRPEEEFQPLSGHGVFILDVLPFKSWVSVPGSQHRRHSDQLRGPGPGPVLSARFQTHLLNRFLSPSTLLTFSAGAKATLLVHGIPLTANWIICPPDSSGVAPWFWLDTPESEENLVQTPRLGQGNEGVLIIFCRETWEQELPI